MRKSEVYSWRLSSDLKVALEDEARRQGESLSQLLEHVTSEWLERRRRHAAADEAEQELLHEQASIAIGRIRGRNPNRAKQARELIRERLRGKRAR